MKNEAHITKEAYLHAQADMAKLRPQRSVEEAVISHAQKDMAAIPVPKDKPGLGERFAKWRASNVKNRPTLVAEFFPMFREMVKDIRQTINEALWGQPEHSPEPGAPLNPTQIMTTDDIRPDVYDHYLRNAPTQSKDNDLTR